MRNGKYGIRLEFYAVMAFILAMLGHTTLCILLLAFVIMVEQDQWVVKQVIQAFCLTVVTGIFSTVLGVLNVFAMIPYLGAFVSGIIGFFTGILSLIVLIFAIIALTKVVKGKEAKIPFAYKFANWSYGIIEEKIYTSQNTSNN